MRTCTDLGPLGGVPGDPPRGDPHGNPQISRFWRGVEIRPPGGVFFPGLRPFAAWGAPGYFWGTPKASEALEKTQVLSVKLSFWWLRNTCFIGKSAILVAQKHVFYR